MATPWFAQFHISDGQAVEKSGWIGVFEKAGASRKAALGVVADVAEGDADEEVAASLVQTIAKEFSRGGPTVTSALTTAMHSAHSQLKARNGAKEWESRMYAGVTCGALQGSDLYLAQAGPSLAYIYSDDRIKRCLPPYNVKQIQTRESLGAPRDIQVHFQHQQMRDGDLLLITSPSLNQLITNDELAIIMTSEPDKAIQRLYLVAKKTPGFSALLMALL
ncbi:MAG: hypothetical protein HYX97_00725 [Chloroflexi bacterium]|nr:hypothetical protein [Chloroflexota bacterium]